MEHAGHLPLFIILSLIVYIHCIDVIDPFDSTEKLIELGLKMCPNQAFCHVQTDHGPVDYDCCVPCDCSINCVEKHKCCPDMNLNIFNETVETYGTYSTCEHGFVDNEYFRNKFYYLGLEYRNMEVKYYKMVTLCPDRSSCKTAPTDGNTSLPLQDVVVVSDRNTGAIFFNRKCAECHGVNDIIEWDLRVIMECPVPYNIRGTREEVLRTMYTECLMASVVNTGDYISAFYQCHVRELCNMTGRWDYYSPLLEEACNNHFYRFYYNMNIHQVGMDFRNPYCIMCNMPRDYSPWNSECSVQKSGYVLLTDIASLFTLQFHVTDNGKDEHISCGELEVYDYFKDECIMVFCPFQRTPYFGSCEPLPFTNNDFYLNTHLKLTSVMEVSTGDITIPNVDEHFFELVERLGVNKGCVREIKVFLYLSEESNTIVMYSSMRLRNGKQLCQDTYTTVINAFDKLITGEESISVRLPVNGQEYVFSCHPFENALPEDYFNKNISFDEINPGVKDFGYQIDSNYIKIMDYQSFLRRTIKADNVYIVEMILPPNCSYVIFNEWELCGLPCVVETRSINDTATCHIADDVRSYFHVETIYDSEYRLTLKYRICLVDYFHILDRFSNVSRTIMQTNIRGIVSVTVTCISLLCIVVTLHLFIRRKRIHSDPEVIFILSLLNLFVAQAVFQFGSGVTDNSVVCSFFGITIHYFWLATVFSFNSYCVLVQWKLQSLHQDRCSVAFIVALLYSYVLPIVLVVINIIYSQTDGNFLTTIGYGESFGACHIDSSLMRAILFALPILLTVLLNLVTYSRIAYTIRNISSAKALNRSGYPYAVAYFRLLIVTGFTWIFGFVNEFVHSSVIAYMFILFVGGQGIVLFLTCSYTIVSCKQPWHKGTTRGTMQSNKTIETKPTTS